MDTDTNKKTYTQPKLVEYGTLLNLTQNGPGTGSDIVTSGTVS